MIPPHILRHAAAHGDENARQTLESTLAFSSLIAGHRNHGFFTAPKGPVAAPRVRRSVYDGGGRRDLPGRLVLSDTKNDRPDTEAIEAFQGSGATYDFYAEAFRRHSIDDRGMRLNSTVHYGKSFANALWNGHQMIYGDGDGTIFNRFTAALDVIAHELTHGVTQYTARLGYSGQTGALNEHISDVFGTLVRQYSLDQDAGEADWLIGKGLFMPGVKGTAIRSMAAPGTAYDDPRIGKDPQVGHMRDYDENAEDNGGVHVNSGIPNHAFYLAATAIGGKAWDVAGRIWYNTLTERLQSDAVFQDFVEATIAEAGALYGAGGKVQNIVAQAWSEVGLPARVAPKAALRAIIAMDSAEPGVDGAAPGVAGTEPCMVGVGPSCTGPNPDVPDEPAIVTEREPCKAGKDLFQPEQSAPVPMTERDPFKAGKDLAKARRRRTHRSRRNARQLCTVETDTDTHLNQGRKRRWLRTAPRRHQSAISGGWTDCLATIANCLDHLEQHFTNSPNPPVILSRRRPEGAKHGEGSRAGNCGCSTATESTTKEKRTS